MFIAKEPAELAYLREEERQEEQQAIAEELWEEGQGDAGQGISPACIDAPYLSGYLSGLRQRLEQGDRLLVCWPDDPGYGAIAEADIDDIEF